METTQKASNRLRLSVLADQLTSSVGGGRFLRGFLSALLSDPNMQELFDHVYILVTQGESIECLGDLPPRVSVIYRRFPNRLRHTLFNRLIQVHLAGCGCGVWSVLLCLFRLRPGGGLLRCMICPYSISSFIRRFMHANSPHW